MLISLFGVFFWGGGVAREGTLDRGNCKDKGMEVGPWASGQVPSLGLLGSLG